jgi:hypothetical protein
VARLRLAVIVALTAAVAACDSDSGSDNGGDAGAMQNAGGKGGAGAKAGSGGAKASGGSGGNSGNAGKSASGAGGGAGKMQSDGAGHSGSAGTSGHDEDAGVDSDGGVNVTVSPEVQAAADAAFEYGYPLTEVMRVCDTLPMVNKAYSKTTLATPADTTIVLPNNDTLYTVACLYVGASWVQLTLPARADRYMSAEIFDAYTNVVGLASARDIPADGATYYLHLTGTSSEGIPEGATVFEVPTPYAYLLSRTLVDGPSDLDAAVAVESGITVTPNSTTTPTRDFNLTSSTMAQDLFLKLMVRLAQNPPPGSQNDYVAGFAKAGIKATLTPDLNQLSDEQKAAWELAYTNGFTKIEAEAMTVNDMRGDWSFPNPNLTMPGTNYALRAVIARFGIFPLPPTESIYPRANADGNTPHVLHLPSDWAPIDSGGFWSLTMYANGYLFDNPINRYSIGDRTPDLQKESDGTLKIYIQCSDPGGALSANWLPAPCGPYSITMRLYLPNETAQAPGFMAPALE